MRSPLRQCLRWLTGIAILLAGASAASAQEFEESDVYFELNDTDGDLGIHALIDGDAWRALAIETPSGRAELAVFLSGNLRRQGLTEFFFESAEPDFDELGPAQFFRRFPEGEYLIRATTMDGEVFEAGDDVTQLMPAPAIVEVNGRRLPVNCDADPLPSVSEPFTISWEPVEMSHPRLGRRNEPIEVLKYQAVLEGEDEEVVFTFDLPPDVTEVEIPVGFAATGDVFKVELLVKEASGGNQTAVESCFEVR
jgi:hypothetical protein